ncbi:MAG: hypothetical protein GY926_17810 [bacterium]|nr:hypothetical protein [bacterium]
MPISDEWDFLPHDDDSDEDLQLAAEELALHMVDPDHPEVPAPREHPRPVRQLFSDEARDREGRDDKEHDLEYMLELQHYAFPEEHPR